MPGFHLSSMEAAPCILFFNDASGRTGTSANSLQLLHLHYELLWYCMTSKHATPVCLYMACVRVVLESCKCQQLR